VNPTDAVWRPDGRAWLDDLEAEVAAMLGVEVTWETPADMAVALDPAYRLRPHLRYLGDRLARAVRDVEAGESRYLLVSMPPRLGKSEMCAVRFPLWLLHRHPDWEVMLLSHAPDLASSWGRQIRRAVEDTPSLGLSVASDAGAVTDWQVVGRDGARGGGVLSKSIRQSVTGRGAKIMILDDVVKDFADAHSESSREYVWDWWTANSRTRLHPPSLVVVVGTRWHEDDIIGRLRSPEHEGDPDQWEVISFPALAEDPASLDPVTRRPFGPDPLGRAAGAPLLSPIVDEDEAGALARWADIRASVGTYAWSALFQQTPSPAKGGIFDADWFRYWRPGDWDDPDQFFDRRLTVLDAAFKRTDDSDYVVMQEWGCRGADRYLVRQDRARRSFTETVSAYRGFIAAAGGAGVHEHVVEDKANGSAVIDTLKGEIEGVVAWSPGQDSKEARARAVSPTVEARQVWLPALADWLPDYLGELKAFPNGRNDDQVDGTTMALLRTRAGGSVTPLAPTGARIQRARPGGRATPVGRPRAGQGAGRRRTG
jgi:predicted phage terminase large subunit-like protein